MTIGSGAISTDATDSGVADSGVASSERGSVVGMKKGRKRKENIKKERK